MGFTGFGKTPVGGMRGFQPPHNANRMIAGFSHGGALSTIFDRTPEFFRSLQGRNAFRYSMYGMNPVPFNVLGS